MATPTTYLSGITSSSVISNNATKIYIADTGNNQVLESVVGGGTVNIDTRPVTGIALDPTYRYIYVISYGSSDLYRIDIPGETTDLVFSDISAGLAWFGITSDSAGNIYYATSGFEGTDAAPFIYKIEVPGFTQSVFADLTGIASDPLCIAFGPDGNMYVGDYEGGPGSGKVVLLNSSGTVINPALITGLGAPSSIVFDATGNLYVTDAFGFVAVYKSNGFPLSVPYIITETGVLYGGGFDTAGNFYFSDSQNDLILRTIPFKGLCFKEGSKLLCLVNGSPTYVPIEQIKKGDLVKTSLNGYKAVELIGSSKRYNPGDKIPSMERLYVCKKEAYPELLEDLVLTGAHSILVDELTKEQREKTNEYMGRIFVTDRKYRLMACLDERAEPYVEEGIHTLYHLALEHTDRYMNYGVYANGLLVETASKRMMAELSGMKLE